MEKLGDILTSFEKDFINDLEEKKYDDYENAYNFLLDVFNIKDEIKNDVNGTYTNMLLEKFFEYGFYAGIKFILESKNDKLKKYILDN